MRGKSVFQMNRFDSSKIPKCGSKSLKLQRLRKKVAKDNMITEGDQKLGHCLVEKYSQGPVKVGK